jgi:hypothetical protein
MSEATTLAEAKADLRQNWEKGLPCPCCTQFVKLYPHTINSQIAKTLIQMYRLDKEWVHILQELKPSNRMYSLARFWGLIEARGDTGDQKASGYWRLTPRGKSFVEGTITVPKHAYIFNDKVYRFDPEQENIREALGHKFSYSELMGH